MLVQRLPTLTAALVLCLAAAPRAEQPFSPRNANYTIQASLDPASRTLTGSETIVWKNVTSRPAASLRFHLYYNAWRDARSTFMRERALAGGGTGDVRANDWGSIDIRSIRMAQDVTARLRFIAPDDGNRDDRTVVELPLDTAVQPGESVNVDVTWTSHVPRTFARTGAIDDYFFIAQWFPKLGVLEDAGWNCHQFHAATEFFSDYGVYDVQLTVPEHWIVGATGIEQPDSHAHDGRQTHHFRQEDVHDFAWTTSPHYLERRERFDQPGLPPVDMRLLILPEHAHLTARHFAAARATLRYYGEWFGPYPYGHITIVDPAWQSGAGGMEYPTLFTAGSRWLSPDGGGSPEGVVIHEAGHQFWYGIVGNNEFENAWMDEGLNTFSTARVVDAAYRTNYFYSSRFFGGFVPWVYRDIPLTRAMADGLSGYRAVARSDVQATPSYRYWVTTGGGITYSKTAVWLHTLENHLGWPVLQRAMSTYFHRFAFRHPRPDDFFATINEVGGRDMSWYFDQVYRGAQTFDYSVDTLSSAPAGNSAFHTSVVARRLSDGVFPVDVQIAFEDGYRQRWHWDGHDQWKMFSIDRPSRAVSAEVDPDRVLVLDLNRTNNSVSLHPRARQAARKWSLTWFVWLQDQLMTYGFFV